MKTVCKWILSSLIALQLAAPLMLASLPASANKNMPDWIKDGGDFEQTVSEKSKKLKDMVIYIAYAGIGIWFIFGIAQLGMSRPEAGMLKMGLALVAGAGLTGVSMFFGFWS